VPLLTLTNERPVACSFQGGNLRVTTKTPQAEAAAFIRGNQVISKPTCLKCCCRFHWSHVSAERLCCQPVTTLFSTWPFHCSILSVSVSRSNFNSDFDCCARLFLTRGKALRQRLDPYPSTPTLFFPVSHWERKETVTPRVFKRNLHFSIQNLVTLSRP
jgi:hypothetical protein